ncbi:antA/AntB antirepressor family protein [Paraburkholderia terrae]|uniref:antA/AntB antirepressor family protein n=1 Tax=Paraburkholderia terrae TaxID=311230 RepID=UPI0020465CCF|nr:antA/AntB antirepressor family protein [Paraburkholderia terrae]BDC37901.1 hypothetical protein PTKU15_11980 [Paraburkholderia terrae]
MNTNLLTFDPSQFPVITSKTIGGEVPQTVNLRDLHEFLGVNKDFTDWAKVNLRDFTRGTDFEVFPFQGGNLSGGRPRHEFAVTLEVAKHICMLSRTAKGKDARDYFLQCEKIAQGGTSLIDQRLATQIRAANDQILALIGGVSSVVQHQGAQIITLQTQVADIIENGTPSTCHPLDKKPRGYVTRAEFLAKHDKNGVMANGTPTRLSAEVIDDLLSLLKVSNTLRLPTGVFPLYKQSEVTDLVEKVAREAKRMYDGSYTHELAGRAFKLLTPSEANGIRRNRNERMNLTQMIVEAQKSTTH